MGFVLQKKMPPTRHSSKAVVAGEAVPDRKAAVQGSGMNPEGR